MSTPVGKSRQAGSESRPKPRTTLFGIGALALSGVAAAIWIGGKAMMPEEGPTVTGNQEAAPVETQREAKPETYTEATSPFSESLLTVDEAPEPVNPEANEEAPSLDIPFELEQVALALSHVDIDEDGEIVLNESAQTILEQAFMDAGPQMNEQQLAQLKTLIEAGLEGPAGAQAVDIAEKFYRYSNAFKEISDTLAVRPDPESLQKDYEQITRLRRTHLGPELADQLYARKEKLTRYTLEVMEIQADPNLTPEQRQEKQQALQKKYPQLMTSDNDANETGESTSPTQAIN